MLGLQIRVLLVLLLTTQKGAIVTYIVYVEDGFVCDDDEIPFDGDVKEMARQWFIEQLQRGDIEFNVEWE